MPKRKKEHWKRYLAAGIFTAIALTLGGYLAQKLAPQGGDAGPAASLGQASRPPVQATPDRAPDGSAVTAQSEKPSSPPPSSTQSLSNTRYGWGIKRSSNHQQPEVPKSFRELLSRYDAYWVGSPDEKVLYLTFDEGYENGFTPMILDVLKANGVKAAFFVTGHYVKSQPELVKRMVAEGHIVGNHTMNHPSLPDLSDEEIKKELRGVEDLFYELTGQKMRYLRPPKGEYSERTLAVTKSLGYHNIFWSLAMVDWVPMPGGPQEAYRTVMDNLHNGAVILLHAVSRDNAEALDRIIKDAKAQGYTFKTLDDLVSGSHEGKGAA